MRISVFGLGYVGAVTSACLAAEGHTVVGVDVSQAKVDMLNRGEAPIIEPGLQELLRAGQQSGRLRATTNGAEAFASTEVSFVCVGTPSAASGSLDLGFVRQVAAQIFSAARELERDHAIVFRSTMLPGSTEQLAAEFMPEPGQSARVTVCFYPEFLREGTAVADFRAPSLSVVGTRGGAAPDTGLLQLLGADCRVVAWAEAELLKYACNAFHAAKVAFANEMGRLGKESGVDAARVMELLCADRRLNISSAYLRPGNPFGGSCLPKDVRALASYGRQRGLTLPLVENLIGSNEQHLRSLLQVVERKGQSEVVILGLSFKPDTDDLRESSMVEVAQSLIGRGYRLRIFDPQLNLAKLVGSNKRLIDTRMPHLASLLQSELSAAMGQRGTVLVSQRCVTLAEFAAAATPEHQVVDINGWPELRGLGCAYEGLCWD